MDGELEGVAVHTNRADNVWESPKTWLHAGQGGRRGRDVIVKISKIIAPPLKRVTAHVVEIKTLQDVASVRDDIGFLRSTFTL